MEKILDVANYVYQFFQDSTGMNLDELQMHKLLYLIQKEAFLVWNAPLFDASFEAWKHGPVSKSLRKFFGKEQGVLLKTKSIGSYEKQLIHSVLDKYGMLTAQQLCYITHQDHAWKKARRMPDDPRIQETEIRKEVQNMRAFDSLWGMYYDEMDEYVK